MDFYQEKKPVLVALDCIIFGFDKKELKLLVIKRDFEPSKGNWSLVGGFLQPDEDLDISAKNLLQHLTGLSNIFMEQLHCFGNVQRDPGERVISVAYYALIKLEEHDQELVESHNGKWFTLEEMPDLIFDHNEMIMKALQRLRQKARYQPIGFELLPDKFTIPELQLLYEVIHQTNFDRRNFSKKILSKGILKKLNEKQKETSKKGAFLYKFDKKKYEALVVKGFNFEL
ncbi:NUDIX hydrolase [Chondrinema litorale]|uniref:NUDIX hydrolase n=1 Tax=Chondrinema litorale TaxID=2994555 RepID=UPI002542C903|nr:NUDIX domain-containing protein [Chondrinema litorale]UZR98793.1 NUDIX domain-containing protein [Chondrinema litorale]